MGHFSALTECPDVIWRRGAIGARMANSKVVDYPAIIARHIKLETP